MQSFSDFIYGAMIAGVVLLIVLSLKIRGEQTSIDAAQFRAAKIGTLSIVEAIERDFTNIGSQRPDLDLAPENSFVAWDTLGVPAYLVFWAQTDSLEGAKRVCYAWQEMPEKTVHLESGETPLIQVERKVDVGANCSGGELAGMSTNMITHFEIHLLPDDSLTVTTITNLNGPDADVKRVLVRLRAVSPFGPGDAVEETRWEKMFRPVNLWKRREV